ncbi:MAG: hypothetical protein AAFQ53_07205 [Bacteroidota bacterium]
MSGRDRTAEALRAIAAWPSVPDEGEIRRALDNRSAHVVAAAIRGLSERDLQAYAPHVAKAFLERLPADQATDTGAVAKRAAVTALLDWHVWDGDLYEVASRVVHLVPVWGASEDAGAAIRGLGVQGLALSRDARVWPRLADLLADSERDARLGAVAAAAQLGTPEAASLLRLRARLGDPDPEVDEANLSALFSLDPTAVQEVGAAVVADLRGGRAESAALALGSTATADAIGVLVEAARRPLSPDAVYTALFLDRSRGLDAVCTLLREGGAAARRVRAAAIPFLEIPGVRERMEEAGG